MRYACPWFADCASSVVASQDMHCFWLRGEVRKVLTIWRQLRRVHHTQRERDVAFLRLGRASPSSRSPLSVAVAPTSGYLERPTPSRPPSSSRSLARRLASPVPLHLLAASLARFSASLVHASPCPSFLPPPESPTAFLSCRPSDGGFHTISFLSPAALRPSRCPCPGYGHPARGLAGLRARSGAHRRGGLTSRFEREWGRRRVLCELGLAAIRWMDGIWEERRSRGRREEGAPASRTDS